MVFYPSKWVDHKIEERRRKKVEIRFGKAQREDETTPIVESVGSSFVQ